MTRRTRIGAVLAGLFGAAAGLHAADGQAFSVSILVGGSPVAEYAARGRIYVEAVKGREFTIRLSNPTSERVAVALSVDGRNVVDAARTTPLAASKWILDPGQTTEIPGWQVSGQTSRKFFFTDTARSYAKWLGDTANVGTIEAVFFREKRRPIPPIAAWKDEARERQEKAQSSADAAENGAGTADGYTAGAPGSSAQPAPEARRKAAAAESFAATGIGRETSFPVTWVAFDEDPHPAARVAIRYEFHEQLVRLGVLPREDDLYARESARGFEHAYAPDPYRHR